ncbi:MAG: hypothetical protein A3D44_01365 [Candidatus Staskawiczbacteria bacterium RIFCSPHIGHO2_02_FULL_42_22]|uniref:Uncharacterized protein n=1 Tax=Candidatus Staskawiczbacteria bacterium RIFCSPHIGHO2_02_FULL_42_22 TaxID=1802207 RepID=A0A1G2I0F0_9BACT|nr:MAG: hypothetical protein A3D44_01365 [Candidatus Staskawiczbacteria bacterium RIFCSPHIGHO2_02_FULL_42_22]
MKKTEEQRLEKRLGKRARNAKNRLESDLAIRGTFMGWLDTSRRFPFLVIAKDLGFSKRKVKSWAYRTLPLGLRRIALFP